MKTKVKYLFIALSMGSLSLLTSCDEEVYDFNGNSGIAYIKTAISTTVKSVPNSFEFALLKTPAGAFGNVHAKFPVNCTSPVSEEAVVELAVDNSLIAKYNKEKNTSYAEISADMVELKNMKLTIPSGQYVSKDSIEISLKADASSSLETKEYLIPIRINSISNGMQVSQSKGVVYIVVKVTEDTDNLWNIPSTDKGVLASEGKADWKISGVNLAISGNAVDLFDNDDYSYVSFKVSRYDETTGLVLDFAKQYENIKRFTIISYGDYYAIKDFDVLISDDGVTWASQGNVKNTSSTAEISFYRPVTARYVKFLVRRVASTTTYLTGINMYI